ncbi:ParB/RepB/Spo0J family partition protein [Rhizohabitans arisaemae]|uniref:ParB/RepB/Spo0J family partition protein n=1 Tax=Rhizohabitans arisaemae TaxID=2720610 RepID=UPI0024B07B90|nr:ParB/RepB/Spo0J family partition protein [Rhizohabitans arisaemae]
MSQQRRGLGKGLGALIPMGPPPVADGAVSVVPAGAPVGGAHFEEIPISTIEPNPCQPRTGFDADALDELAASIREVGLLQPVVVRPVGEGRYELVMGERRWRASKIAGLERIPAIVRITHDNDLLRDALIENIQRQQLNPLDEAAAYQQLLNDFGATHEQLGSRIGRSRSHITNTLRLLNLPPKVQLRVAAGVLSAGHARALLALEDPAAQDRLAQRIVEEQLSVRAVEEIVAMGDASAAPQVRARPIRQPASPGLVSLADQLSDRFETKVRVDLGKKKGRIVVEFATMDDLERIIGAMAPDAVESMHAE